MDQPVPLPPYREIEPRLSESEEQCKKMLYQALWSKTGYLWLCSHPDRMLDRLQRCRRKLADPDLMTLHIWRSRIPDGDIMIAHGKRYQEQEPTTMPDSPNIVGLDLDLKP
jgi:hypothetical protein